MIGGGQLEIPRLLLTERAHERAVHGPQTTTPVVRGAQYKAGRVGADERVDKLDHSDDAVVGAPPFDRTRRVEFGLEESGRVVATTASRWWCGHHGCQVAHVPEVEKAFGVTGDYNRVVAVRVHAQNRLVSKTRRIILTFLFKKKQNKTV